MISDILKPTQSSELRSRPEDFSRKGILTPERMITILLFMAGDGNRRGYRHILDAFWDECASLGIELPTGSPVSASAFCQAREKISLELLTHVLHGVASRYENTFPEEARWRNRRVLAVDGTKINLQRSDELDAQFGRPTGGHVPQALVSTLVNVSGKFPLDVGIAPYASCERKLLIDHLSHLRKGDILVLDRGYPAYDIFCRLHLTGADFLVRVAESHTFKCIDMIRHRSGDDFDVDIPPVSDAPVGSAELHLRAVRLHAPDGSISFYLTSLPRAEFSIADIRALYRMRWESEEVYRTIKSGYFDQRQFHGRSTHRVKQEILVQNLFLTISRFLMACAAKETGDSSAELSIKSSVLAVATYVTRIFLDDPASRAGWLPRFLQRIARTRDKKRAGRVCPRRSFKPGPRWGPDGRRGA